LLQTEHMGHEDDSYRQREAGKTELWLNHWYEMHQEEVRIENGEDTNAEQLDRYLAAASKYYKWVAQNPAPEYPTEKLAEHREENTQEHWRYNQLLTGSYHHEKADFCHEQYLHYRGEAEKREADIASGEQTLSAKNPALIAENRKKAANWLRMEASCLEMPTARPQPSRHPEQSE
jgi:hypothetical protein